MRLPLLSRRACRALFVAVASAAVLFAQAQPGGGQSPGGQSPGGQAPGGQPGGGTRPGTPQERPQTPSPQPRDQQPGRRANDMPREFETQQGFYISGKVVMQDGTPPPERVIIETSCGANGIPQGYTDSKGRFGFQLGENAGRIMDASVGFPGMPGTARGAMGPGCELRAVLPGFRSTVVSLAQRRPLDNPDVGILVLHPLVRVEGFTFSVTTAMAPKEARKAHEKGLARANKRKWAEAEAEFRKAVDAYPKYAAAWYDLGRVYAQQDNAAGAKQSFLEAVKIDPKFVSPYPQLARIAVVERNWEEAVKYSAEALKLNPYLPPDVYYLSAVGNYGLERYEAAEEHAREAVKLDSAHKTPRSHYLLGILLAHKKDHIGAAEQLRLYLKYRPDAQDAATVRQQLADLEKRAGVPAAATR